MSIQHAVHSPAPRAPVAVVGREVLARGNIVKTKIPLNARQGVRMDSGVEHSYFQFCKTVAGGLVNVFVHGRDASMLGKWIVASATVLKKTLADGRQFIYVDLHPVADDEHYESPNRLIITDASNRAWANADAPSFATPAPLKGIIVFAPQDAKMGNSGNVVQMPPKRKTPSTGDGQLDRLIDAGWVIKSENGTEVTLSRMRDGKERTMVHHRPKKKKAPNQF